MNRRAFMQSCGVLAALGVVRPETVTGIDIAIPVSRLSRRLIYISGIPCYVVDYGKHKTPINIG